MRSPLTFRAWLAAIGLVAAALVAAVLAVTIWQPPSTYATDNADAGRYYEDALSRFEQRDFEGTILQLKNALQADKTMLQAHLLMGKALLQTGNVSAAEVAFNEALRLGINRSEVVLPLAKAVVAQGKQAEVIDPQKFPLAGLQPSVQAQLLVIRSGASADIGDQKAALKALDEARVLDPKSVDAWLAEVPIRIRARQFKEAEVPLERARAIDPNSAEMHYQKGSLEHVQGHLDAAIASYERALAIDSRHVDSHVARAGIYIDSKRDDAAAKDVATLLSIAPDDSRGWYLSALLAERAGKQEEARSAMARITALIDPVPIEYIRYRPQILLLAGQAHYGLGERERAKPFFEAFQRLQPDTPVSKLLAEMHQAEGNHDRAVESLELYLRSFPGDAQAMALLASAHMAKGRHARAASLMQDAVRSKDAAELYTAYGLSLIGIGQSTNAIHQLETAYKKDPGQTQAAYALVGLYLRSDQVPRALAIAQALVTQMPSNPSFQNMVGLTRIRGGDVKGARAAFEQAIKLDSTLLQAQLNLARLETGAKNFDRATTLLESVLKTDESNTSAMFEMASLAERRGQQSEALRWLTKAFDTSGSKDLRASLALVDLLMRNGQPADALKVARQIASNRPDELAPLLALARVQLANSDAAAARNTLTTATRIASYDASVQVEIALLQIAAGNVEGAAYSLEKAFSTKPDLFSAHVLMTDVEIRQGQFAKAEQRAQQIATREPKLPIGQSLLGDLAMARHQPAAAVGAYRKAHQIKPNSESFRRLFRAQLGLDPKAALQEAEQWLKASPMDAGTRQLVAEANVRIGNMPAAKREYEQLRQLLPKDAGVANNLANVLLRMNDPKALAVAESALELAPNDPVTIDTVGWIALSAGDVDRSVRLLRDARLRSPDSAEVRYHLAAALAKSGKPAEAREELRVALQGKTAFEGRASAEALLRTLK